MFIHLPLRRTLVLNNNIHRNIRNSEVKASAFLISGHQDADEIYCVVVLFVVFVVLLRVLRVPLGQKKQPASVL